MTRDKMGECESASRHPRMATRFYQMSRTEQKERELIMVRSPRWRRSEGSELEENNRPISLKKSVTSFEFKIM